jgi:5-methylcytosine-specific restriction enzyme subunit McrC
VNIPVGNVYRMLAYALGRMPRVSPSRGTAEVFPHAEEFLADWFAHEVTALLLRGLHSDHRTHTTEARQIAGKVDLAATVSRHGPRPQLWVSQRDTPTPATPAIELIASTLRDLANRSTLPRPLRSRLSALIRRLPMVVRTGSRVPLRRTLRISANDPARHAVRIANWIQRGELPNPTADGDEQQYVWPLTAHEWPRLFERFVRNFYAREQSHFPTVRGRVFRWHAAEGSPDALAALPQLRTDVCLQRPDETLILDAKFYHSTLSRYYDRESVHSAHLYQMLAYCQNLRSASPSLHRVSGVIVYPTTDRELDFQYNLHKMPIRICTVNLSANWQTVHARLLELIALPAKESS